MTKDNTPITPRKFIEELRRYEKGSITRRHFLGAKGLGTATAVMGGAMPGLMPRRAGAQDLGNRVALATWPNCHDTSNFDRFTDESGVFTRANVFGSNEEMLDKLQAGARAGTCSCPPTMLFRPM